MVRYVNSVEVRNLMEKELASGRFFSAKFVKRTDNTLRNMTCQCRPTKRGIGGGKKRKSRSQTGLLTVYDVVKQGYRTVNLSGVRRLRMHGIEYRVKS